MGKPEKQENVPLPPEYQKMIDQANAMNGFGKIVRLFSHFGIGGSKAKLFAKRIDDLHEQSHELFNTLSRFNDAFQSLGWIMSESRSMESAKDALALADAGKLDEAEELLVQDYDGEKLDFLKMRFQGVKAFRNREHIIDEAVALCHEGRYTAAIPLILMVADGVGQDCFGKAIFSEGTDLTELNAIAGHKSGLPLLTANFARTRQKFNDEEITFPYRHGIIHGRDVNYGNRLVAAKAWAYLVCISDVIRARQDAQAAKPEPELTLRESLQKYQETQKLKKMIEAWQPRPVMEPNWTLSSTGPNTFEDDTPEIALVEFLKAWQDRNYGTMGERTVYFDNRPIKKRAGQIRQDMEEFSLVDACIVKIEDQAAAITEIECMLTVQVNDDVQQEPFTFRMVYGDEHSSGMLRGQKRGSWKIVPYYQGWVFTLLARGQ